MCAIKLLHNPQPIPFFFLSTFLKRKSSGCLRSCKTFSLKVTALSQTLFKFPHQIPSVSCYYSTLTAHYYNDDFVTPVVEKEDLCSFFTCSNLFHIRDDLCILHRPASVCSSARVVNAWHDVGVLMPRCPLLALPLPADGQRRTETKVLI